MHRLAGLAAALSGLTAAPAMAHTGAPLGGFVEGVAHPLLGLDHVLAMAAVGAWAGQFEGRARWALPLVFVAAMAAGALPGFVGVALPAVEAAIALSVLLAGLAVARAAQPPLWLAACLVAPFAAAHGHAHGLEAPGAESAASYAAGFLLATLALHAAGFGVARLAAERPQRLRLAGAAVALAGAALLAS